MNRGEVEDAWAKLQELQAAEASADKPQASEAYQRPEWQKGTSFENAPDAAKQFNEAVRDETPQQPAAEPTSEPYQRPEWQKDTSFENAPDALKQFNESAREDAPQSEAESTGVDSQQVRDSGMDHEMRPPPEIAQEPDREKHKDEMARDDEASRLAELQEMASELVDRQEAARENEHERGGPEPG